jgi:ankyrin repeat protein
MSGHKGEKQVNQSERDVLLVEFADGRTDLVFDLLEADLPASYRDQTGVSLIQTCAYFGDVSAIRFLLANGESLESLGANLDLNGASFHGHWRLCKFLLEHGANVNEPLADTKETPLHAALCKTDRLVYDRVLEVLLAYGANPNLATADG